MPRGDLQSAETLKRTFDALVQGGWIRPVPNGKKGMFEVRPDASELLKAADSADSADTDPVLPGQQQFDDVSAGADRC
jgi:hypothetical protein